MEVNEKHERKREIAVCVIFPAIREKILQVVILIRKRCSVGEELCHAKASLAHINHSSIDFPINFNSLLSADVCVVRADGVKDSAE